MVVTNQKKKEHEEGVIPHFEFCKQYDSLYFFLKFKPRLKLEIYVSFLYLYNKDVSNKA